MVFSGNNVSFSLGESRQRSGIRRKLSKAALLGIVVACCVLVVVALILLIFVLQARRKENYEFPGNSVKVKMYPERVIFRGKDDANRIVFFVGCNHAFDLVDLLRASAEVLGKGTFGLSYKAILEDTATVVLKWLKEVGVGRRDFELQLQILGRIKHDNFVELMAYYYSMNEKLMVYDYHPRTASLLYYTVHKPLFPCLLDVHFDGLEIEMVMNVISAFQAIESRRRRLSIGNPGRGSRSWLREG